MIEMIKMVEIWRPILIDDIKPYYYISTFGRIYSTKSNKYIIPQYNENGYLQVGLMTNNGNRIYRKVHRLVMITFCYVDNYKELQVNHKDTNKTNNYIYNLEWVTPKENTQHAILNNCRTSVGENNPCAKITEKDAIMIYNMIINNKSDYEIANIINCSTEIIRQIALGYTWSYLFTNEQLDNMKQTRTGYYISEEQKHLICKYYLDNINKYETNYGKAKKLSLETLQACGVNINEKSIRIARRLFFKLQNPEICTLYNY